MNAARGNRIELLKGELRRSMAKKESFDKSGDVDEAEKWEKVVKIVENELRALQAVPPPPPDDD